MIERREFLKGVVASAFMAMFTPPGATAAIATPVGIMAGEVEGADAFHALIAGYDGFISPHGPVIIFGEPIIGEELEIWAGAKDPKRWFTMRITKPGQGDRAGKAITGGMDVQGMFDERISRRHEAQRIS